MNNQNENVIKLQEITENHENTISKLTETVTNNEKKYKSDLLAYSSQLKLELTALMNQTQNSI